MMDKLDKEERNIKPDKKYYTPEALLKLHYEQLEVSLLLLLKYLPVETKLKIAKQIMHECAAEVRK